MGDGRYHSDDVTNALHVLLNSGILKRYEIEHSPIHRVTRLTLDIEIPRTMWYRASQAEPDRLGEVHQVDMRQVPRLTRGDA